MTKKEISNKWLVFFTIITSGLCSIIYELLVSTTSSYLLGDSIKQFSLVIGVYMASMGVGSYISQYIEKNLLTWFVKVEIILGLVGGLSVPLLYSFFDMTGHTGFQFIILFITFLIGLFTGFEIPLLIRFLKEYFTLKSNLAYVLSLDYIGALIATLVFPFIFLPFVGIYKTSLIFGISNLIMGYLVYHYFSHADENKSRWVKPTLIASMILLTVVLFFANTLLAKWENSFYNHEVIFSKQSQYQQINLTKNKNDVRLYINKVIQWSSIDEYRYHESLGYLPVNVANYKKNVLILGGGEGLLAREILKNSEVEKVTIVDLDKVIFDLAKNNNHVKKVNQNVFGNPKLKAVEGDAMQYLQNSNEYYDVIIADLPDPTNESLSRFFSTSFYKLVQTKLSIHGVFATQATSPYHTNKTYWCIVEILKSAGFNHILPYHTYVPSFGEWGFVMASKRDLNLSVFKGHSDLKFLDTLTLKNMLFFDNDLKMKQNVEINKMDNAQVLKYYNEEWTLWNKEN